MTVRIRPYENGDSDEWLRMRRMLWPEIASADEAADAAKWLVRRDAVVLVAERSNTVGLAGFVEIGARPYADGCTTSPVAYLEGWYVDEDVRRQGIGAALLRASETWAQQHGFHELASDTPITNAISHRAHTALGFMEVERAILYRKSL